MTVEGSTHFPRVSTTTAVEIAAIIAPIALIAARRITHDDPKATDQKPTPEQARAQAMQESIDLSCGDSEIIFTSEGMLDS